ncbi:hypothetical protein BUALT_Bualt18G0109900 [Buddleja alternifolia]|uniref:Helicase-like transcription factor CHR28 n=1 Tax=Buddleja alternifolia TaxID=168488 RepID=A0AAV6WAE5_9LAMI|nr:hypothetical protein BUALT_Bualt18G0109900 [Buddleja alternifolia]
MIMVEADESPAMMDEMFGADGDFDDVVIDLESLLGAIGGPPDLTQDSRLEDLPFIDLLQGAQASKPELPRRDEIPGFGELSPSYNSEALDYRMGRAAGFSESAGNSVIPDGERVEPSSRIGSTEHSCSRSVTDCTPVQVNGFFSTHADGGYRNASSYCQNDIKMDPFETSNHSNIFSFHGANHEDDPFGCSTGDVCLENLYQKKLMEETNLRTSVARMEDSSILDGDRTSHDAGHTESSSYEVGGRDSSDILSENDLYLFNSEDDSPYFPYSHGFMDEERNPTDDFTCTMPFEGLVGSEVGQDYANYGIGSTVSLNSGVGLTKCSGLDAMRNKSKKPPSNNLSNVYSKKLNHITAKKIESVTSSHIVSQASEVIDDVIGRKYYRGPGEVSATEGMKWSSSNSSSSISSMNYVSHVKDEKKDIFFDSKRSVRSLGMAGETPLRSSGVIARNGHTVAQVSEQPSILPCPSIKSEPNCLKMENEVPKFSNSYLSNITCQGVQDNMFEQSKVGDDPDVCILEDMSGPARSNPNAMNAKLVDASQFLTSRAAVNQTVTVNSRIKPNDERVIFRVALQDLSQPKSEATPPDGALAVPLLKHQRIALSWMVNKETKSACCSGGILADDQGLGKTISTIALILKERSPSSKAPKANEEQGETETLNLDEDDDGALETYHVKGGGQPRQVNGYHIIGGKKCVQAKGRPSGGTLIVCPTSVLRQWSDELHNKVTSEANLSVLVYHGSNRTKDPLELAKYDVVVTTYAIVSMEVPKQPVVDENDDKVGTPFKDFSSSRKRERKSSTSKKKKNEIDNELLETISGPLAKVGWFRVVLDEAQSIKNHRTQAARACWGLRAKRRWCLSGTPIQNAIDDLYSYFRFLRHEPYAVFKVFREQLKVPIHRNPKNGYKKLQAVLKTIMLRRTKGSRIDGEPIINIPPKTIELKKVDFSEEEREFYCRLEADSQAQFAEYAAAGTVKQNYVNILLMLLRLRQACDHPLLVKGFNSNSRMTSCIEMAKKLSREKQHFLLNCLEASLAICGICRDPPEDAVVTVCGHVFCNQCISEHIIGDDTQCPTKNCKTHINMSCVFSIATLRIALSDNPSIENTANCSDSELAQISEPYLQRPEDSSKIRAALNILLSLSKPHDCASSTNSSENSDMISDSKNSVRVVGEKAIVFSQWTRMLDLLEACLKNSSIQYRRLDGTMPVAARDRAVKDFNTLPQVTVMIMSLKAASLGLNMVAASSVLLLDLWWNPTTEDQAIDRAHRIGQTRPVSVFRLTVKDTVEDRILALQQRKRRMVASAFGENETGGRQTRLTVEDLKYLFRG